MKQRKQGSEISLQNINLNWSNSIHNIIWIRWCHKRDNENVISICLKIKDLHRFGISLLKTNKHQEFEKVLNKRKKLLLSRANHSKQPID